MKSREDLIVKVSIERLKEILRWREVLPIVRKAIGRALKAKRVYVFGSCISGDLTADSDVDIAVILDNVPENARKRAAIVDRIWRELEEEGVSFWYPLEIHLITLNEKEMLERGGAKFVEIDELLKPSENQRRVNPTKSF